jgi:adenine-specific DNA-methyltransferase
LDPPYNSRNYFSNYFLLEVIAQGWFEVQPEPEGLTGITNNIGVKSEFSSKREVGAAFSKLIADINCDLIAISYNNEGLLAPNQLMDILTTVGKVTLWDMEHKRYRSINQDGSNSSTSEKLYVIRKK